jgi:hypothetical protein
MESEITIKTEDAIYSIVEIKQEETFEEMPVKIETTPYQIR